MGDTLKLTLLIATVTGAYGFILPSMISSKSNELTILGAVIIIGTVAAGVISLKNKLKGD